MAKKTFEDGTVLLTGDDMIAGLEALWNHRGSYDRDCSFCQNENNDDLCSECTVADFETSCSCHINPPCSKCIGSKFEVSPYLINYENHKNGRKQWECFKGDKDTFEKLKAIEKINRRLSAEILTTGEIAMYIDDGNDEDENEVIEICSKAKFKATMCKMIMNFNQEILR